MGMGGVGTTTQPIIPKTGTAAGAGATTDTSAGTATTTSTPGAAGDSTQVGGAGESSGMQLFQSQDVSKDTSPVIRPPEEVRQEFASDIKPTDPPADLQPTPPRTEPTQTTRPPEKVSYTEPPAPPELEKVIEVAGSGMGADKKFKMYPSELAAMYAILKEDSVVSLEDMQKKLKTYYGIDTEIQNGTLVNTANGHAMISDTNGNGALDMGDMDFAGALKEAGIDPASIPKPGDMMAMMGNVAYWANYWAEQMQNHAKEMNRPAEAGPAPSNQGPAPASQSAVVGANHLTNDPLVTAKGGDAAKGEERQFTMQLSELTSMYALIKKQDQPFPIEDLQKQLKEGFGIDAQIKNIDGQQTLVNPATGHALISDTNGSGKIDPKDLNFEETLRGAGVNPDLITPKTPATAG